MASIIGVNEIQHTNGTTAATVQTNGLITPAAGGIVQVQYTQYTGTTSYSISAETDTALTDLTVNITPTSTSSKILIQTHVFFEMTVNQDHNIVWMFMRDSTVLKAPTAGSRREGISAGQTAYYADDKLSTPSSAVYQYFDSPSTTSAITYKVAVNTYSAGTFYVNRSVTDTDSKDFERGVSYISVTEIAG